MIARARTLAIMLIGVSATVSPGPADRPPWLIWNASASVPIGLYAIHTVSALRVGDLVVVKPPEPPGPRHRWSIPPAPPRRR